MTANAAVKSILDSRRIYFFEEGQRFGGIGETFADKLLKYGFGGKYSLTAVEGEFPKQNTISGLLKHYGLDAEGMTAKILEDKTDD